MNIILDQLRSKPIPRKREDVIIHFEDVNNDSKDDTTDDQLVEVNVDDVLESSSPTVVEDKTNEKFDMQTFVKTLHQTRLVRAKEDNINLYDNSKDKEEEIIERPENDRPKEKPKQIKKKKANVDIAKNSVNEVIAYDLGEEIKNKLPNKKDIVLIKKPTYYMNNREYFIRFANSLFSEYRKDLINSQNKVECDKTTRNVVSRNKNGDVINSDSFSLLTHQKIILDYLNIYTPYRGLLIYHGLGSGKTCSSIAVAESFLHAASTIAFTEGMMQSKKVVVMTPASLRVNYFEELKKCGDPIYKKKQYWKFVPLSDENPKEMLATVLQLPMQYIESSKGAWMVDVTKKANYSELSPIQKQELDKQLNEMIHSKYQFINYNGLQKRHMNDLTKGNTENPFDNKVVIIDEAHNFISRIVNKLGKQKKVSDHQRYISTNLYHLLMKASNVKIVLLSGTPIINYPHEIGVMFNILRGYIRTFSIPISTGQKKYTEDQFKRMFSKHKFVDYLEYKSGELSITRTPFGFVNKFYGLAYKGVRYANGDEISDYDAIEEIVNILKSNNITVRKNGIKIVNSKALPDNLADFEELFFDKDNVVMKNNNLFKRRILGLTSYFKSAKEELMPKYDTNRDMHIVKIQMSDYQFSKYQEIRLLERSNESKQRTRKAMTRMENMYDEDNVSSYRIFSRAFCNFVFPDPPGRPMPGKTTEDSIVMVNDEDNVDAISFEERIHNSEGRITNEDDDVTYDNLSYQTRVQNALSILNEKKDSYLTGEQLETYSPKFVRMLENVDGLDGLHLIYSQFRTIEGIGVFSMVLEANGFHRFKLKKNSQQQWELDMPMDVLKSGKTFALYTGTETAEEKEIIRHIYNGTWEYLPLTLAESLRNIHKDNVRGELIKVFMITASGAEGISLANTRYIHIMEPYWHPVRTEQVIGRARRICSHIDLPESERNVKVFYYLMSFTDEQIEKKMNIDIRNNDTSKIDRKNLRPLTSDESLYERSNYKAGVTNQILKNVKEASIDCSIHSSSGSGESLECYSFGNDVDPNVFSYKPNIHNEVKDGKHEKLNVTQETWRAKRVNINGIDYAIRLDHNGKETDMAYDLDSFQQALKNPNVPILLVGKITERDGKRYMDTNI